VSRRVAKLLRMNKEKTTTIEDEQKKRKKE
jgi:hypothetical protein